MNRCLVLWKSRAQRSHTLSSTEAEYVVLSEIYTEILFVQMIMELIIKTVEYPMKANGEKISIFYLMLLHFSVPVIQSLPYFAVVNGQVSIICIIPNIRNFA